jgi:tRNA A-37 threonylcarbamoyl transferase component Bud32
MIEFLSDPDASLQLADMQYLKQGNTCTVWTARVDQRMLVVKRYNIKGLLHRISRAFRRSRAAASWKNAHMLGMCGIHAARPVALLEERFGLLRGRAWYISEYVQGDDAMVLCKPDAALQPETRAAGESIVAMLNMLACCRISHGDMKATNFILTEQGAIMIDLDAMQQHACGYRFRRQQQRDLRRFMRNWNDCPEIAAMFNGLIDKQVTGQ